MKQAYTVYHPGALLGLIGSAIALAGLFFLPLATVYLPSTHEGTTVESRQLTAWSLLIGWPLGVGNALVALLMIAAALLFAINVRVLTREVSPRLIIIDRVIAMMGGIMQAVLCLLILFSAVITRVSSRGTNEVTSTELGLFLLMCFIMTMVGAFLVQLPPPVSR